MRTAKRSKNLQRVLCKVIYQMTVDIYDILVGSMR